MTMGCLVISVQDRNSADAAGDLARFRREFYGCLTACADALFELTDAIENPDTPESRTLPSRTTR
jgi:hypothetical protein